MLPRSSLQGVEHALTQEWKSCPSITHALNKLELVDLALDQAI
jgi:hypothetical protein